MPAAVASPVVSVSRQTSGASGRRLAGQRRQPRRDRAGGRPRRPLDADETPAAAVDDLAVDGVGQPRPRDPARDRRVGQGIGRGWPRRGSAARKRSSRRASVGGTVDRRRGSVTPRGDGRAAARRPSSASSRSASASASTFGLEPRSGARRTARLAAAAGDERPRRRRAARRGAPTAAPTGRPRRAPPRTGRSSAASWWGERTWVTSPRSRGSTISRTLATVWIARPAPEQRDVELVAPPAAAAPVGGQPVGGRLELELGQVDRAPADVLVGQELELLVERDEAGDHHLAVDPAAAGRRRLGEHVERLERHRPVGVGVVVDVDPVDVRLALVPLEPVDVVLDRLVDVDRVLVDEHLGPEQVDLAEDPRAVRRRVDDHDVLRRGGPQRDLRGREVLARPVPAPVAGLPDVALLGEERQQVVGRARARTPRPARTAARTSRRAGARAGRGGCPGRARASSGVPSSRNSGWWTTYWSTGAPDATRTATLVPGRRPARPNCCHVAAIEPG